MCVLGDSCLDVVIETLVNVLARVLPIDRIMLAYVLVNCGAPFDLAVVVVYEVFDEYVDVPFSTGLQSEKRINS